MFNKDWNLLIKKINNLSFICNRMYFKKVLCRVSQKKHGNSVTNSISSLLWISIVIPNFKSHNIIMSAKVYFMKRSKDCKEMSYNVSARWTVKTDKFTLFVQWNFLVLLSTIVCRQNIKKQNVNIADETLTDYSFLSYHYTISKNYLKRRYRIRHWIPMFFGTPCM